MSRPAKLPRPPILCYVTDRKSIASEGSSEDRAGGHDRLVQRIAAAAAAGVDWIQIREKDLSAKDYAALVRKAVAQTRTIARPGKEVVRIFVNDRLDIAITEQAAGVHLGENSLPVRDVYRWLHLQTNRPTFQDFLVGASCHSQDSAISAARDGADYLFFGPIFATPSKTAFGAPQGLIRLKEVCYSVSIPVLAIGGITGENASACLAAGAAGLAAIRLFQESNGLPTIINGLKAGQSI